MPIMVKRPVSLKQGTRARKLRYQGTGTSSYKRERSEVDGAITLVSRRNTFLGGGAGAVMKYKELIRPPTSLTFALNIP